MRRVDGGQQRRLLPAAAESRLGWRCRAAPAPCNLTLRDLAQHARAGILAAGGTPVEFNTIAITDGIAMGSSGMRASLASREVIADSIELAVSGHCLDGVVVLVGCM